MAIDHARDDDGGDSDAVGDFSEQGGGGAQRWRSHVCPGVAISHDCYDEVHGDVDTLEEEEGARVLSWVAEFGDEGEESDVAWIVLVSLLDDLCPRRVLLRCAGEKGKAGIGCNIPA